LSNLNTLDLAYNKLERIGGLDNNFEITELWLNYNNICDHDSLNYLSRFKKLETIYVADNPIA